VAGNLNSEVSELLKSSDGSSSIKSPAARDFGRQMSDASCAAAPNGVMGVLTYSMGEGGGGLELRSSSAHSLENPTSTAGPRMASVALLSPMCSSMPRAEAQRRTWRQSHMEMGGGGGGDCRLLGGGYLLRAVCYVHFYVENGATASHGVLKPLVDYDLRYVAEKRLLGRRY
jgi:hypothetical protein